MRPRQAIEGFLRSAGLTSVDQAEKVTDPKKGDLRRRDPESPAARREEIIADVMPGIIPQLSLAQVHAFGALPRQSPAPLRWVRPLQSIVCMFGPEHDETVVIPFVVDDIVAGMSPMATASMRRARFTVRRFRRLRREPRKGQGRARRRAPQADHPAGRPEPRLRLRLELVEDEGLLDEVSGLVEYPHVLMGTFEEEFLEIPAEIIRL